MSAHAATPAIVLHVPHASFAIPAAEREAFRLDDDALALEMRRMTDAYTDELYELPTAEATTVAFPVNRLVVDPERFTNDAEEPMSARGMGVLYTRTSHGELLRDAPAASERTRLLATYYTPHHERLTTVVNATLDAHGACFVVDCHSFPLRPHPYEPDQSLDRPEICLGTDAFHTPAVLIAAARRIVEDAGFSVALDRPFAGALVPMAHYRRDARVAALMIEVRRDLYMNESTGERRADFEEMRARVQGLVRRIITAFETFARPG
jgi:N-formylglutamate amidohydrolase